jgi:hypothetical protein
MLPSRRYGRLAQPKSLVQHVESSRSRDEVRKEYRQQLPIPVFLVARIVRAWNDYDSKDERLFRCSDFKEMKTWFFEMAR